MSDTTNYDAIVVGSGQGGGPLARKLAGAGQRVALVESEHVGGTCVNDGCTPTKTMIASARVAHLARRAGAYGVDTDGSVSVDMERVRQRKRDVVEQFRSGSREGLENTEGLDLIDGKAIFVDEKTLEVRLPECETKTMHGDRIILDTGARPLIPSIDGLENINYLDSTSIMERAEAPDHLIVLGGGYVGLEFAQMFRRFGSAVTIIERGEQLLAREDEEVAKTLADILREDGVEVRLSTEATTVARSGAESVTITLEPEGDKTTEELKGSHLLVATGRRPNTDALNLEAAGVDTDEHGHIQVNERLETTADGVFALGDVTGGPPFTHISYDDHRILEANLLHDADRTTEGRPVPYTVYTDPQLGRVGLTEAQAREENKAVEVATLPMSSVARAIETDETRGLMKAVVDAESKQILGVAILGVDGGEVMSVVQTAMMGDLPYTALRDSPFAHPTLAESLNNLFAKIEA